LNKKTTYGKHKDKKEKNKKERHEKPLAMSGAEGKTVDKPSDDENESIAEGALYHDIHDQPHSRMKRKVYEKELKKLAVELVKLQEWVKAQKLKVVVIFEAVMQQGREV
jgi:polyphosphate kinase 2 (PPK2 family)